MRLLLIAATKMEINEDLFSALSTIKPEISLDILITGIGIPSTIYNLTNALTRKKYDIVIQIGIAGTFTKKYIRGAAKIYGKIDYYRQPRIH